MTRAHVRRKSDTDAKEEAVKFLFLLHGDADGEAALPHDERMRIMGEHIAYAEMLRELGVHVSGEALDGGDTALVVRPGEQPIVTDGPFAETKEALGGFYIVDVPDRDEAIRLAGKIPLSPGVAVEVLRILEF